MTRTDARFPAPMARSRPAGRADTQGKRGAKRRRALVSLRGRRLLRRVGLQKPLDVTHRYCRRSAPGGAQRPVRHDRAGGRFLPEIQASKPGGEGGSRGAQGAETGRGADPVPVGGPGRHHPDRHSGGRLRPGDHRRRIGPDPRDQFPGAGRLYRNLLHGPGRGLHHLYLADRRRAGAQASGPDLPRDHRGQDGAADLDPRDRAETLCAAADGLDLGHP